MQKLIVYSLILLLLLSSLDQVQGAGKNKKKDKQQSKKNQKQNDYEIQEMNKDLDQIENILESDLYLEEKINEQQDKIQDEIFQTIIDEIPEIPAQIEQEFESLAEKAVGFMEKIPKVKAPKFQPTSRRNNININPFMPELNSYQPPEIKSNILGDVQNLFSEIRFVEDKINTETQIMEQSFKQDVADPFMGMMGGFGGSDLFGGLMGLPAPLPDIEEQLNFPGTDNEDAYQQSLSEIIIEKDVPNGREIIKEEFDAKGQLRDEEINFIMDDQGSDFPKVVMPEDIFDIDDMPQIIKDFDYKNVKKSSRSASQPKQKRQQDNKQSNSNDFLNQIQTKASQNDEIFNKFVKDKDIIEEEIDEIFETPKTLNDQFLVDLEENMTPEDILETLNEELELESQIEQDQFRLYPAIIGDIDSEDNYQDKKIISDINQEKQPNNNQNKQKSTLNLQEAKKPENLSQIKKQQKTELKLPEIEPAPIVKMDLKTEKREKKFDQDQDKQKQKNEELESKNEFQQEIIIHQLEELEESSNDMQVQNLIEEQIDEIEESFTPFSDSGFEEEIPLSARKNPRVEENLIKNVELVQEYEHQLVEMQEEQEDEQDQTAQKKQKNLKKNSKNDLKLNSNQKVVSTYNRTQSLYIAFIVCMILIVSVIFMLKFLSTKQKFWKEEDRPKYQSLKQSE